MKATIREIRELIREGLLLELRLIGEPSSIGDSSYRAIELSTFAHGPPGKFIIVPTNMPEWSPKDKEGKRMQPSIDGYLEDYLGLNKKDKPKDEPHYYAQLGHSLVVNHEDETINLDVSKATKRFSRRQSRSGNAKAYTIPHADTSFDNVHELQKIISSLRKIDPQISDSYKIVGSPDYESETVGSVFQRKRPGDQIVKGGDVKPLTLYHGTSSSRYSDIKTKGLVPGNAPEVYADLVKGYSEHNIYLASTITEAENYATRAAVSDRSKAVVLNVTIKDFTKLVMDEDNASWMKVINPDGKETEVHFQHNEWKSWPNADRIMQQFMSKIASSLNKRGTVAYKGRIPASDITVHSTYKPAVMKRDPSEDEYFSAREKTLATLKLGDKSKK